MRQFWYFLMLVMISSFNAAQQEPKISIITSLYKGELFIEEFLQNITKQTIFDQCELIIINANSPEQEEPVIINYMQTFDNIIYRRLDYDPGIYGVWNMAINMARGKYITNANVDDRLKEDCYQVHAQVLDANGEVGVVYSGTYITQIPNETMEHNSSAGFAVSYSQQEFSKEGILYEFKNYPNNHPMWRKVLHTHYGLFDQRYKSAGDLEMWLRLAICGNVQFKKIDGFYSLYYGKGISSRKGSPGPNEKQVIAKHYRFLYENIFKHITLIS